MNPKNQQRSIGTGIGICQEADFDRARRVFRDKGNALSVTTIERGRCRWNHQGDA
jgi:hypothetical protein